MWEGPGQPQTRRWVLSEEAASHPSSGHLQPPGLPPHSTPGSLSLSNPDFPQMVGSWRAKVTSLLPLPKHLWPSSPSPPESAPTPAWVTSLPRIQTRTFPSQSGDCWPSHKDTSLDPGNSVSRNISHEMFAHWQQSFSQQGMPGEGEPAPPVSAAVRKRGHTLCENRGLVHLATENTW